jgi:glycosyltransferase involved in cell wall biosynthesis
MEHMFEFGRSKNNCFEYDITFICRQGKSSFAEPILKELEKTYSIQVLSLEHKRDYSHAKIRGKVIWVEWAQKFCMLVSRKKWKGRKVFVRLHRYEIDTSYMRKINWKNIDKVVFVNRNFENQFIANVHSKVETVTIPNAITIKDFPMHPIGDAGKLLSYSMAFRQEKGYLELLDLFARLLTKDDSYHLSIMARKPQTNSERSYMDQIDHRIQTLKLQDVVTKIERETITDLIKDRKNISKYLSQHDAIISFSHVESFHYAFAEGLLCGLQGFYNAWVNPLIRDFWDRWGYHSEEEMIEGIIHWSKLSTEEKRRTAMENRKYVIDHFASEHIGSVYARLFFH